MAVTPVATLSSVMKSAGMAKITKLGKVIAQQGDDVIREATFANGRVGTYRTSNFMGTKTQTIWDGQARVTYNTARKGDYGLADFYSKAKGDYVELLPRTHSWDIRKPVNGIEIRCATGNTTITPLNVKSKLINGKVKQTTLANQEIHTSTRHDSDNGYGTIYAYKDVLLDTTGKSMPIYQRPNTYVPAYNAGFGKDLSKKPVYACPDGLTQYTGQTPIATLNKDLNAGFKTEVQPLWSKLQEMLWHLA